MQRHYFVLYAMMVNLRSARHFKVVFWIKVTANALKHGMFALAWKPFYANYGDINGWTYQEHLLMIGLVTMSIGVTEIFFDGLRELPTMIEKGSLDRFLLLPRDPVLTLSLSQSALSSWSDLIAGVFLLYASGHFDFILLLFIPLGVLFFFSLYLYIGSLRFFIPDGNTIIHEIYSKTLLIANQPNAGYSGFLKILTNSLIPVALVSYFPIEYRRTGNLYFLTVAVVGGMMFHIFSRLFFLWGLRYYDSASGFRR